MFNLLVAVRAAPEGNVAAETTLPGPVPRSVLIVDDDARVRRSLRALIDSSAGLSVSAEASSAPAALRADEVVAADVVVLDLLLPSTDDGLGVLRRLVARGRVVVAVSIHDAISPTALAAGAVAFVGKAAGPDPLLEALRGVPLALGGTG